MKRLSLALLFLCPLLAGCAGSPELQPVEVVVDCRPEGATLVTIEHAEGAPLRVLLVGETTRYRFAPPRRALAYRPESYGKANEWAVYRKTGEGEEGQWGHMTSYAAKPRTTYVIGAPGEVEYDTPEEALASLGAK